MGRSIGILFQTMPYLIMRTLAYFAFALVSIAFWVVFIGLAYAAARLFGENAALAIIVMFLIGIGVFIGLIQLAERFVFYAIKAGHVAVITELLTRGKLPDGVNQVEFGKQAVQTHFGTMAAFAAVDALVEGAVRQVLSWLSGLANFMSFVPGLDLVWSFVRQVFSVAGNYIDEAVLSYILCHPGQSVWKSAADGVVLYAQGWKQLLTTALLVVLIIGGVWLLAFLPFFGLGLGLGAFVGQQLGSDFAELGWVIGLVLGGITGGIARSIIADPLAMVMIVTAYHQAIAEQVPQVDMYAKLQGVSRKFNELSRRAQEPVPA